PMLEHFIGNELSEVSGAGNQDALQPDAGLPPPLERPPNELAGCIGEDNVDHQIECPDELRYLVHAEVLQAVRHVVRVVVEGSADAEDHGEDAADENGKEIVDAGTSSTEVIHALNVEGEGQDPHDEGKELAVVLELRVTLRHRDEAGEPVEPKHVRESERRATDQCVCNNEEEDEQAVVPPDHRAAPPSETADETAA